jgi:hypothetical protein
MPAQKPISREYRIYLALWRKALLNPDETVRIKAPTFSMAVAMRQGMYRAIRNFRNGEASDNELQRAAEKYVVYLEKASAKEDPHWLELRDRKTLAALDGMFGALGIGEEDLLLGDERTISSQLRDLMEPDDKPTERTKTPFYQRD